MPRKPFYKLDCTLTQREIAEAMGVRQPAVSRWLNGWEFPRYDNLCRLADAIGIEVGDLAKHISEAGQIRRSTRP